MTGFRKHRSSGSMFKWYFIQTTVSVLLCLIISGFSILFFFISFWKTDRLTALKDDALSISQSVSLLSDNESGLAESRDVIITNILQTIAQTTGAEVFLVSPDGDVVFCSDINDRKENGNVCLLHSYIVFSDEFINEVEYSSENAVYFEGSLAGFSEENFFVGAAKTDILGDTCYAIVVQSESEAFIPYTTEFVRIMLFASIIAIAISFILSLSISIRMVRPLKKITAATKHYAGGDFSARIDTHDVYKEMGELVDSVNKMADSLAVIEESRSSFIANVSHELKTPMTIISGFVDGILDGTISQEETNKYLYIVSDEVKRLSRLVVAMLNMSKIEAGKLTLNMTVFSVKDIFIKTCLGFEKYINEKEIELIGLDALENISLTADETLINQIIYNLIDNAVKFTPHGGSISFSLYTEKKEAVFSVKNTGNGIPSNECELIFDRFYKVDKSRGLDAKSFGMGLYIVKSIIELHKGSITLNNKPDEYTEFIIRIPLQNF